jgi:hypothetical protein
VDGDDLALVDAVHAELLRQGGAATALAVQDAGDRVDQLVAPQIGGQVGAGAGQQDLARQRRVLGGEDDDDRGGIGRVEQLDRLGQPAARRRQEDQVGGALLRGFDRGLNAAALERQLHVLAAQELADARPERLRLVDQEDVDFAVEYAAHCAVPFTISPGATFWPCPVRRGSPYGTGAGRRKPNRSKSMSMVTVSVFAWAVSSGARRARSTTPPESLAYFSTSAS